MNDEFDKSPSRRFAVTFWLVYAAVVAGAVYLIHQHLLTY